MQELVTLEEQGWKALSSEPGDGQAFCISTLRDDAIMLFPSGMKLVGKEAILSAIASQPWESFEMTDVETIMLSQNSGVIVYSITACRAGMEPYTALISSTYTLTEGKWRLVIHQRTPS